MRLGRQGVDMFQAVDRLTEIVDRLKLQRQEEDIQIPLATGVKHWRWQFDDGRNKAVLDCSRDELLMIVDKLGQELARCQSRHA